MGFISDFATAAGAVLNRLSFLLQLVTASLSWAFQQQGVPPKYQYRDTVTSDLLMCDQCPPGTAVKRHCTVDTPTECEACPEKHFAENWHWGDTCQYCTSVCVRPTRRNIWFSSAFFVRNVIDEFLCTKYPLCVFVHTQSIKSELITSRIEHECSISLWRHTLILLWNRYERLNVLIVSVSFAWLDCRSGWNVQQMSRWYTFHHSLRSSSMGHFASQFLTVN